MVKTLFVSTLREIRKSLGRYLAILAIIGLGVGFFAGLRMCQPSMMATGEDYLTGQRLFDFQVLSTLGFTEEDVEAFSALEGVAAARGAVYADVLIDLGAGELVFTARSLTEDINTPSLTAGRMPQALNECLGDARVFDETDLGRELVLSPGNEEDTLELMACDRYTLVGLAHSPVYLNHERGTSSIGSGSVTGFLYIPLEGFDFEAFYEVYLRYDGLAAPYSDAYNDRIDTLTGTVEDFTGERARLRYDTLRSDAQEEIDEAAQELADGWEEYYEKQADTDRELQDALKELQDGEREYTDAQADYEQGKLDYAEGLAEYRDGEKELEDAWTELEDARLELEDAWATLEDARLELEDARAELDGAEAELEDAKREMEEGEESYENLSALHASAVQLAAATGTGTPQRLIAALQSGQSPQLTAAVDAALQAQGSSARAFVGAWTQAEEGLGGTLDEASLAGLRESLDEGKKSYKEGLAQYESGLAEYEEGRKSYEEGLTDYQEGKAEYDKGLAEYRDGEQELQDAWVELEDAERTLADAPGELEDARRELDDGWKEYYDGVAEADGEFADALTELEDGEAELADARKELDELEEPDTYVLTRSENTGYACFENDTSIVAAISLVFPVFFFLVAALVCMTTMTRMVDEERTQIGVLKALGYSGGQIMGKYLFYAGSASLVGCVAGYAVGAHALPWIIWQIYAMMYGFAPLRYVFDPVLAAVSFAAALLCSVGATWISCRAELRQPAAELIRPKSPKAGRRVFLEYITPLWRRLSFLHKVSVRNVLRYRSRLIMMVLGIGGCTALLVTGFGLKDSIRSVLDRQYEEITLYDYAVTFREGQSDENVEAYLADRGWDEGLLVHQGSVDALAGGRSKSVYLVASASNTLEGYIDLHQNGAPIAYPGLGEAVLTESLAESLGLTVGESLELRSDEVGSMHVKVSAVCDNYVWNYIYLAPETVTEQTGEKLAFNTLYLHGHQGADPFQEGSVLSDSDEVSRVAVNETMRNQVDNMLSRMDLVVLIVVVCAGALAFIVLYNLTNINITERVREIATIKVLGFFQGEVVSYVFREIGALSVLGSLVGLPMGKALHWFVMAQVRIDAMSFPVLVYPVSYLYSFGLTMLFTVIVALGLGPRLRRIDMAESLKSIE